MIFFILFRENLLGFTDEKFYVIKAVALCIFSGILDRSRDDLNTADLSRLLCKERRYRSDSTVEIPDRLTAA